MLAAGCMTAAIVLAVLIPDKGEVVRLMTRGPTGEQRETDLWIAEVEGDAFFRAGSPRVDWLARLESAEPSYVVRQGRVIEIQTQVEDDPRVRALLNRAMAEKYGLADRIWGLVRSSDPVAIRIQPVLSRETIASENEPDDFPAQLDPE
jgi:hypothetical protein